MSGKGTPEKAPFGSFILLISPNAGIYKSFHWPSHSISLMRMPRIRCRSPLSEVFSLVLTSHRWIQTPPHPAKYGMSCFHDWSQHLVSRSCPPERPKLPGGVGALWAAHHLGRLHTISRRSFLGSTGPPGQRVGSCATQAWDKHGSSRRLVQKNGLKHSSRNILHSFALDS